MSIELLYDITDAGWEATVRRSPATPARPNGKVLRWQLVLPNGLVMEARTGPQLLDGLIEWCRANMPEALTAPRCGVPVYADPVAEQAPQGRARSRRTA